MAKLHIESAGLNSGAQTLAKKMRTADIKTTAELSSIFEIEETVLESVVQSMKQKGFDPAEPIVLWKETGYVVDGHTRLRAAQLAGITEIPVTEKHFETLDEAQAYTEARQINRRNLSQAEIFRRATCATNKTQHDGTGRTVEKIAKQKRVRHDCGGTRQAHYAGARRHAARSPRGMAEKPHIFFRGSCAHAHTRAYARNRANLYGSSHHCRLAGNRRTAFQRP